MNKEEMKTILEIALGSRSAPEGILLMQHPITGVRDSDGWYFFPSKDNMEGVHRMKLAVLDSIKQGDNVVKVTWHNIAQYHEGIKLGNQVVVEVETVADGVPTLTNRYLAADMTDYSGFGRGTLKDMEQFTTVLCGAFSPSIAVNIYQDTDRFTWMWQQVSEAAKDQEGVTA